MELRNKRKGVPAPQQDIKPGRDSSGAASKRVKSKPQQPPERSSRRLRNLEAGAGPSSGQEGPAQAPPETPGHRSNPRAPNYQARVKQELLSEPDHAADLIGAGAMAGSTGQAEPVRFRVLLTIDSTISVTCVGNYYHLTNDSGSSTGNFGCFVLQCIRRSKHV